MLVSDAGGCRQRCGTTSDGWSGEVGCTLERRNKRAHSVARAIGAGGFERLKTEGDHTWLGCGQRVVTEIEGVWAVG